ncbi:MAG: nitrite reductase (NAD(P)H) small subunit [Armatimonadota bacterium]|nr:nitrite reductase (NAD(P)H) small subunit [Armatimonadota bacterium]
MTLAAEAEIDIEFYLGPSQVVRPGAGRAFDIGLLKVAIFRTRDRKLYAVENRCPRSGVALASGNLVGCIVVCPLRCCTLDLRRGACLNEPFEQVRTFGIREVEGQMLIRLEQR